MPNIALLNPIGGVSVQLIRREITEMEALNGVP